MIEITKKLKLAPAARKAYGVQAKGKLTLTFEFRQKSRARIQLGSGEEIALMLPRGEVLRGGDLVVASDGRVIEVVAAPEQVLHVTCATSEDLTRAAYHLGNRHVPVEVGEGYLRILADHVLEEMLKGLGATVAAMEAPFEPEAGAYTAGGTHQHPEAGLEVGGARIHEFGDDNHRDHGDDHRHAHHDHGEAEHVHGPDCAHDHGHEHHGHSHDHGHHEHEQSHDHAPAKRPGRPIAIPVKSAPVSPVHVHGPDCDHGHGHDHGHDHDHAHGHEQESHAGKILYYSEAEPAQHVHGPDCAHDHGHEHHDHAHDHAGHGHDAHGHDAHKGHKH